MSLLRTMTMSVLTLTMTQSVFAGAFDELNSAQQGVVLRGGEVMVRRPFSGGPWPSFHAYVMVNSTPEEAAAVFTDFNIQKDYTEKSVGSATFEPLGTGTLVVYRSSIVPKPLPGYLFWVNLKEEKYIAKTEAGVKDTVVDLRVQVSKEVKTQRSLLDAQVSRLQGIIR